MAMFECYECYEWREGGRGRTLRFGWAGIFLDLER
ncbi:MAG: hypothetical protein ACJAY7_000477 [Pseudohongiellaceae bacterium]|jgi:hypothetical protein